MERYHNIKNSQKRVNNGNLKKETHKQYVEAQSSNSELQTKSRHSSRSKKKKDINGRTTFTGSSATLSHRYHQDNNFEDTEERKCNKSKWNKKLIEEFQMKYNEETDFDGESLKSEIEILEESLVDFGQSVRSMKDKLNEMMKIVSLIERDETEKVEAKLSEITKQLQLNEVSNIDTIDGNSSMVDDDDVDIFGEFNMRKTKQDNDSNDSELNYKESILSIQDTNYHLKDKSYELRKIETKLEEFIIAYRRERNEIP